MRQLGDDRIGQAQLGGIFYARHVVLIGDATDADILAGAEAIANEILEDDADMGMQVGDAQLLEVDPVDGDASLVRIVEPGQQLDDGGLACAILANQRQGLASLEGEIEMADRPGLRVGIAEAHILEDDALPDWCGEGLGIGRRENGRLDLEEAEQVIEIHRLAGDLGEAEQDFLEQAVEAQERAGEEGQVADGKVADNGAPDYEAIGAVIGERRYGREQRAPGRALGRKTAVLEIDGVRQLPKAGDEEIAQPEQLELLGGLGTCPDMADILELAPFRGPPAAHEIGQRIETGLAPDGRHKAQWQQQDQPGRIKEQARCQRHHGDHVLRLTEHLAEQGIAARCLATRPLQPVLVFGGFEMPEVQPGGMGHQLDTDRVGMQLRQHGIDKSSGPGQEIRDQYQAQLDCQQHQNRGEGAAAPPVAEGRAGRRHRGKAHDFIDDQLAHEQHGQRLQR